VHLVVPRETRGRPVAPDEAGIPVSRPGRIASLVNPEHLERFPGSNPVLYFRIAEHDTIVRLTSRFSEADESVIW